MTLQAVTEMRDDNHDASMVLDMSLERCVFEKMCASHKIVKVGVSYGHAIVWLTPTGSISWMTALGAFDGNILIKFEMKSNDKTIKFENRALLLKELQEHEFDDGKCLTEGERAKRSRRLASLMKQLFDHRCMFCGVSIETGRTPYTEAHHVDELGNGGKDVPSNIAIVCPNHHQTMHHGTADAKEKLKLTFKSIINHFFITEESGINKGGV